MIASLIKLFNKKNRKKQEPHNEPYGIEINPDIQVPPIRIDEEYLEIMPLNVDRTILWITGDNYIKVILRREVQGFMYIVYDSWTNDYYKKGKQYFFYKSETSNLLAELLILHYVYQDYK